MTTQAKAVRVLGSQFGRSWVRAPSNGVKAMPGQWLTSLTIHMIDKTNRVQGS